MDREEVEALLRETETKYRRIVDTANEGIVEVDEEGAITFVNAQMARMLGYAGEEMIGQRLDAFMFEKDLPDHSRRVSNRRGGAAEQYERRYRRRDGQEVWMFMSATPIFNVAQRYSGAFAMLTDITERKQAEEAIRQAQDELEQKIKERTDSLLWVNKTLNNEITERRQAEEALRHEMLFSNAVINALPGVFYMLGPDARFIRWNRHLEEMSGMGPDQLRQISALSLIHEEDCAMIAGKIGEVFEKGPTDARGRVVWQGKNVRHYYFTSQRLEISGSPALLGIGIDITEQKQLEEQLLQSQKMEAVGKLAGGIAHDFNNLLGVILGGCDLVLRECGGRHQQMCKDLEEIKKAAQKAAELTRQLLAYSRKQQLQPAEVNLNTVITDMREMLRRLIGEDIELVIALDPGLKQVLVDPGQKAQVIMNLVVNAKDAMPKGGKLTIATRNVVLDDKSARLITGGRPGEFVCMSVIDTGIGMDRATMERIFEPFFSTKGIQGTGLGLSVIYGITEQHGGWINVESEPGKGTEFMIYLPALEGRKGNETIETAVSQTERRGNRERILLVEDEAGIRKLVSRILEDNNYIVFAAADVGEAVQLFERERGEFHLLFTDSVLPDKSGVELVQLLLPLNPRLKVMVTSGYLDDKSQWETIIQQGYRFLQKPYELKELLTSVDEVLKSGAA